MKVRAERAEIVRITIAAIAAVHLMIPIPTRLEAAKAPCLLLIRHIVGGGGLVAVVDEASILLGGRLGVRLGRGLEMVVGVMLVGIERRLLRLGRSLLRGLGEVRLSGGRMVVHLGRGVPDTNLLFII